MCLKGLEGIWEFQAFWLEWLMGMSAPSLHRESTDSVSDSLIIAYNYIYIAVASLLPSSPSMEEPSEDVTLYIYIGMSGAAVVLIVAAVIVISLVVCLKKRQKVDKTDIVNVADNVAYGTSKDRMELSENIAYGTTTFRGKEDGYVSTTVNDITSPNEAYATTDNVPVVNNQAYGMVHH